MENKYIPRNRVGDGVCDCGQDDYFLCDDEWPDDHYIKKHISFSTICDGFTELISVNDTEGNETDEPDVNIGHVIIHIHVVAGIVSMARMK
jgi:hypothetical protein